MSLFKQLLVGIMLFTLLIFTGSFVVNLESSREQLNNQLSSHAQDAATALGVSLTPHIDDPVMIELLLNSIFDSGYYSSIRLIDQKNGQVLDERVSNLQQSSAPEWFAGLVRLQPGLGEAVVMRGWEQAARVEVVSHPQFALARLWKSTLGSLLWLLLCSASSLLLGAWLLRRQLRPLNYMVEQSQAITRREFISLPDLPSTPEFRRVVEAMNLMVEKLKALFAEEAKRTEELRVQAYQDGLTGLSNRRAFDMHVQNHLDDADMPNGYLLLIRICDLAGLNQKIGGERTDRLLAALAEQMRHVCPSTEDDSSLSAARVRGGEFALFMPGLLRLEAEKMAEELALAIENLHTIGEAPARPVAHLGLVPFQRGDSLPALMRLGDQALCSAENQGLGRYSLAEWQRGQVLADDRHIWFERLDQALSKDQVALYLQSTHDARNTSAVLHHKVLARLLGAGGEPIAAGQFLPWLNRFGWSERLDRLMVQKVLELLPHSDVPLALNLSTGTLRNLELVGALLQPLSNAAGKLILEVEESQLQANVDLDALAGLLAGHGCQLGVQHFGGRFSMIGNLSRLGLAYLKVDGSFIRQIDQEQDKCLFIEALQRAANSIDLPLIAERVETEGELKVLADMGVHGVAGRLFGEPQPSATVIG
ncbi:EAL domain-containing protein [Pseudomonas sp. ABC1]|uniref:bifunctional diguanylate cyclase/phosphodiesterase n=1 Tax=Pseudomonas sp. ABC1 TaxID=2748080 RepID=UPI0015C33A57|nr:LapD/MoxY N-terminal periplasmic domain-containing protein [Pseudomonas sp. ABC1]QLF94323.1 EAL domain-containing protein [Pseudomonas sp. ABC1]